MFPVIGLVLGARGRNKAGQGTRRKEGRECETVYLHNQTRDGLTVSLSLSLKLYNIAKIIENCITTKLN